MSSDERFPHVKNSEWVGQRASALSRLQDFIPEVSNYAARRNYALPGNAGVSRLSPYLRHRLISEEEVIASVTSVMDFGAAEKFIQEVVWRTYWKGALHLNPALWCSFEKQCSELSTISSTSSWASLYEAAKRGETCLQYFNDWVHELISTGYLHNHVRMWFASIWIFTLKIPWQLGAAFMYHHLLDGDPASNTLSWRWVAGLHTKGKTYLARADNIAKYSEGRWVPHESELAAEAFRIDDDVMSEPPFIQTLRATQGSETAGLILTTDDLSIETMLDVRRYATVCLYAPGTSDQTATKGAFLGQAIQDLRARLAALRGDDSLLITDSPREVQAWCENQKVAGVFIVKPHIGPLSKPVREVSSFLTSSGASVSLLERSWDAQLFPLCDRGFFTMWERFKKRWATRETLAGYTVHG